MRPWAGAWLGARPLQSVPKAAVNRESDESRADLSASEEIACKLSPPRDIFGESGIYFAMPACFNFSSRPPPRKIVPGDIGTVRDVVHIALVVVFVVVCCVVVVDATLQSSTLVLLLLLMPLPNNYTPIIPETAARNDERRGQRRGFVP